jgi:hypothetical protein
VLTIQDDEKPVLRVQQAPEPRWYSESDVATVSATATDNVGVVGVQFLLDGAPLGNEDTTAPYSVRWNTNTAAVTRGSHTLSARARDAAGNVTTSAGVPVTVQ